MRGSTLAVLLALPAAIWAMQLPLHIQADRHLVRAQRQIEHQDYAGAQESMDQILEIQTQHDLEIPEEFFYRYAEVLKQLEFYDKAMASASSPQGIITSLPGKGKLSNEQIATLSFTPQSVNAPPELLISTMISATTGSLVAFLGFATGTAVYAMLLWMVLGSRREPNWLMLSTGVLGLTWNLGAFFGYVLQGMDVQRPAAVLLAAAYGSLCFLPAVVVDAALRVADLRTRRWSRPAVALGYGVSAAATLIHFYSGITGAAAFSQLAFRLATVGFASLVVGLLVLTRGWMGRGRLLWVVAMAVFALSALHLADHHGGEDTWWLALLGHHASLPLALLILYQDYRFAFADIFLKRALAIMLLVACTLGTFVLAVRPFIAGTLPDDQSILVLIAFPIFIGLLYPALRRTASWFVDAIVLHRFDYGVFRSKVTNAIDACESDSEVLDTSVELLAPVFAAEGISWGKAGRTCVPLAVRRDRREVTIRVPTVDHPTFAISIRSLADGRRLLSDDVATLERVALEAARKIDQIRAAEERYQRKRERQEIRKLATEAELRALRAQINPHFLFNALTTISYLIQTSPERAQGTLMRLSGLLRGVLKVGPETVTLGEELDLVEAYLDIERARFEERMRVRIDVPWELRTWPIPALILQPIVENAVKHGISRRAEGGEIRIEAHSRGGSLSIKVADTGPGPRKETGGPSSRGLGLRNVEARLKRYGPEGALTIRPAPDRGTLVELRIPLPDDTMREAV